MEKELIPNNNQHISVVIPVPSQDSEPDLPHLLNEC